MTLVYDKHKIITTMNMLLNLMDEKVIKKITIIIGVYVLNTMKTIPFPHYFVVMFYLIA